MLACSELLGLITTEVSNLRATDLVGFMPITSFFLFLKPIFTYFIFLGVFLILGLFKNISNDNTKNKFIYK
jgi:hypothetical protein